MGEKERYRGFDDSQWDDIEKFTKELIKNADEHFETPNFIKKMIKKQTKMKTNKIIKIYN